MIPLKGISFHDARVVALSRTGASVRLSFSDVEDEHGRFDADLEVLGVSRVVVDDIDAEGLEMELDSGDVVLLKVDAREVLIIVQWNGYEPRRMRTRAYGIVAEQLVVRREGKPIGAVSMIDSDSSPLSRRLTRERMATAVTHAYCSSFRREKAAIAWRRRDYASLVEALDGMGENRTPAEERKLEYAVNKLKRTDG